MNKECENCIKRKTMWCPTSCECMALDELPYHLDKISALEKIDKLEQKNKQLNKKLKEKQKIIDEIEYFVSNEYIYDEVGMKIIDRSKLQDKIQELKEKYK